MSLERMEADARRAGHRSAKTMTTAGELRVGFDDRIGGCWHMINLEAVSREQARAALELTNSL